MSSVASLSSAKVHDILVVGGGHAGCEAALAAARLGADVCLATGSLDRIAAMSCNPAVGGVGKGHLVKELDALGGEMGRVADATGVHFRTLNESRGPAVRATRCQSDMHRYAAKMSRVVHTQEGISLRQEDVVALLVDDSGRARGIRTGLGREILARQVILTTGTFLGGVLHRGDEKTPGGRAGESPARGLSASLAELGLQLNRMKTGTCPRVDGRTIDRSRLEEQTPDLPAPSFSFEGHQDGVPALPQVSCFITHTNAATHKVIQDAVDGGQAPLFNGQLSGAGPRYCPSLEDKVIRFPHKESHLIFLEPHGLDTHEVYPNGLSTSLPPELQLAFLRTIEGLENVEVTRWGYAVEYDHVDPTQLSPTLETHAIPGLFCAGQLNGTTGYEEAAIQGFLAGVNAVAALRDQNPLVLGRGEAYAGVLVDDLVTKGVDEPYRMLTSRAEHRLLLREDNTWTRLLEYGDQLGLVSERKKAEHQRREQALKREIDRMMRVRLPATDARQAILAEVGSAKMKGALSLAELARRSEVDLATLLRLEQAGDDARGDDDDADASFEDVSLRERERAMIEVKYAGYIDRAAREIERDKALDEALIPVEIFGERLPGMSREVHEKLAKLRPRTLGQAARVSGVTPAAVGLLAVEIRKRAASG